MDTLTCLNSLLVKPEGAITASSHCFARSVLDDQNRVEVESKHNGFNALTKPTLSRRHHRKMKVASLGVGIFLLATGGSKCCEAFVIPSAQAPVKWKGLGSSSLIDSKMLLASRASAERPLPSTKELVLPDYLIFDSDGLTERPPTFEYLTSTRVLPRVMLTLAGVVVAGCNIVGYYGDAFLWGVWVATVLGVVNGVLDLVDSSPPYSTTSLDTVSSNVRSGAIDDAFVHFYSGVYTISASWLTLRASPACPEWMTLFDPLLGSAATVAFLLSLAAPVLTLLHHASGNFSQAMGFMAALVRRDYKPSYDRLPPLTELEVFRVQSLVAIGVVGCIFAPEAIFFAVRGQEWWSRVSVLYPGQPLLETSTAMIGVLATQTSMVGHCAARQGVARFREVVPAFAVVCFVLAILPCLFAFHWLGDEITWFDHYSQ